MHRDRAGDGRQAPVSNREAVVTHYAAYPDESLLRPPRRPARRRTSATAWFLRAILTSFLLAGGVMLVNLLIGLSADLDGRDGRSIDPTPVALFIGDQRLVVPANMFRFPDQRNVGPHDRVDLAVHFPEMAGYTRAFRKDFLDLGADAPVVFLTIRRRDTPTDSVGRLINVYQHFFEEGSIPAPAGLVGHRMSEESGLSGEEVFFEAGSTNPFTTHCTAPDDSDYPASCLTEIHAGNDLSVQIRFRKGLLADWAGIKSGVRVLLLSFGVTA
jgi:hypothetical protein